MLGSLFAVKWRCRQSHTCSTGLLGRFLCPDDPNSCQCTARPPISYNQQMDAMGYNMRALLVALNMLLCVRASRYTTWRRLLLLEQQISGLSAHLLRHHAAQEVRHAPRAASVPQDEELHAELPT